MTAPNTTTTKRNTRASKPDKKDEADKRIDAFLSPLGISSKKSKKKDTEDVVSHLPVDPADGEAISLAEQLDLYAAYCDMQKAAEKKVSGFRAALTKFFVSDIAQEWAERGKKPASKTWAGLKSSVKYILTCKMSYSGDKREQALQETGVDIYPHVEVTGAVIDYAALEKNPAVKEAYRVFLKSIPHEDLVNDKYIKQTGKFKEGFFEDLFQICDEDPEKFETLLEILQPAGQFRSTHSQYALADQFDIIRDLE